MNLHSTLPVFLALTSLSALAADWPQYRGPNGDGRAAEKIASWPAGGPKQVWKMPSEGGFSSFAVAGGRAFTLSLKEAEGGKQESLVAMDAKSGKELWFAPLNFAKYDGGGDSGTSDNKGGDGPRSTPATDGTHVFTTSSQLVVRAFEAATGKVIWTRDLVKEHGAQNIRWQNAASPLLEGELLYVAGGGSGQSLLALRKKDGSVAWKLGDEKMTHATPIPATIQGQRQVIFFVQSGLISVEPKSGKELWRYPFQYSTSTAASPVVVGDIVYCSAGYGVGAGAAKISKQGEQWTAQEVYRMRGNKPLANHWSTPVAKDGFLYGMFQFKEYGTGPVKCVDVATGQVKWEKEGFGPGHVVLVGDNVLALSDAGELVLFAATADAYKELGRTDILEGKCWTTPVVSNGRIYARSTKEAVCVELPTQMLRAAR